MFDHHSRNKGWGICQQKLPNAGQTVEQFFQMLGACQKGGGMLMAGIDSYLEGINSGYCIKYIYCI